MVVYKGYEIGNDEETARKKDGVDVMLASRTGVRNLMKKQIQKWVAISVIVLMAVVAMLACVATGLLTQVQAVPALIGGFFFGFMLVVAVRHFCRS